MRTLILLLLTAAFFSSVAQPQFEWAHSFGDLNDDKGLDIVTDQAGNSFTTGEFEDTVDFDPGPGVLNLSSGPSVTSAYICKLNASGNLVWAKSFGGVSSGPTSGYRVAVDASNNVYICGTFAASVDLDPGPGVA